MYNYFALPRAIPRWIAVTQRFKQFHNEIVLTNRQNLDACTKCNGIINCLNRAYYQYSQENSLIVVGSWGKNTAVRPPRDVDIYFVLPQNIYYRFQNYLGNKQSALLQEIKNTLVKTYPDTKISGDGQVVVVNFNSYSVEVIPAFETPTRNSYLICDANNGGHWKIARPYDQIRYIDNVDNSCNHNLRPLIRMVKTWQTYCSVPIKSFYLELLAAEFIFQSQWCLKGWFYFDWIIRDFFEYIYYRANETIVMPGTSEIIELGHKWQSRVESAFYRAKKACDHEYDNRIDEAGDEWQKIFGNNIPRNL